MCLTTNNPTIKKAKGTIFCYKAGSFQGQSSIGGFSRGMAYHALQLTDPIQLVPDLNSVGDYEINPGYHSFNSFRRMKKTLGYADYGIFAIPAGTDYIDGTYCNRSDKNRVSSQIMYVCPATFRNRIKAKLGLLKIN